MTKTILATEHQALVHLAWWRADGERRLVFGWLEQLPLSLPRLRGHPFRSYRVRRRRDEFINVARFPMSYKNADVWFEAGASGDLRLPAHPEKDTPGDRQTLTDPPMRREPEDGSESSAMELPFLPSVRGAVFIRGLFGSRHDALWEVIAEDATAAWLAENMFIDFRRFPEFVGSLHAVRHHPILRSVDSQLSKDASGERELVRFTRWPGSSLAGLRLLAIEKRALGLGKPVDLPVRSAIVEIDWGGKIDRTAMAVVHPEYGVSWWREPLPYLRTMSVNIGVVGERRRIVLEADEHGKSTRHYDVDMVNYEGPLSPMIVVGEEGDSTSPAAREAQGQARRRELTLAASLGLRWFDKPDDAEKEIRALITRARKSVMIVDPYLGPSEVIAYGVAISNLKVTVDLVTSAERMRDSSGLPRNTGADDAMEAVLQWIGAEKIAEVTLRVLPGKVAQLHDRFIVADGRVWLSGNSLNAIGSRASILIEIPNPQEVLSHLRPIISAAVPFEAWISDRRRAQAEAKDAK
jgi:hypothetical protein